MTKRMTTNYSIRQDLIAKIGDALGHPARVLICSQISEASEEGLCFSEIWDKVPLAKATVSQHITVLKNAGLLTAREARPKTYYTINKENWETYCSLFNDFLFDVAKKRKK